MAACPSSRFHSIEKQDSLFFAGEALNSCTHSEIIFKQATANKSPTIARQCSIIHNRSTADFTSTTCLCTCHFTAQSQGSFLNGNWLANSVSVTFLFFKVSKWRKLWCTAAPHHLPSSLLGPQSSLLCCIGFLCRLEHRPSLGSFV